MNAAVSATQIHRLIHTLKARAGGGGNLDTHYLKSLIQIYCSTKIVNPDPQQKKSLGSEYFGTSTLPPQYVYTHTETCQKHSLKIPLNSTIDVFLSFNNYKYTTRRSYTQNNITSNGVVARID